MDLEVEERNKVGTKRKAYRKKAKTNLEILTPQAFRNGTKNDEERRKFKLNKKLVVHGCVIFKQY